MAEDAGADDAGAGDTGADDAGTPHPSPCAGTLADADALFHAGVGQRIRRIRRARGLTQERCAAALGISFQQLQKYEKGRNRIAACTLVRLAEVLEVAPDALLDDTTDPLTVPPPPPARPEAGPEAIGHHPADAGGGGGGRSHRAACPDRSDPGAVECQPQVRALTRRTACHRMPHTHETPPAPSAGTGGVSCRAEVHVGQIAAIRA
ncbi:helix-turn-helix domain-containing protein [Tistrella bauzanensis]|uniref:helix-turn-helix domain-containing protein n=1 Tax=Tistrella bauzanensis TaxID=657419 RepID=UPI00355700B1